MTESSGKMTLVITVRTADGTANQHQYLYNEPLSEEDRASIRALGQDVRSAFREPPPGFIHFVNPAAWYRSSQVISVVADIHRDQKALPVEEVRRIGFV